MATMKANIIKVKVYPKDLKAIPDILPYRLLIQGDPMELELDKKEIWRCMNFADVYDMTSGEEIHIDEEAWAEIVEYVEAEEDVTEPENPGNSVETEDDHDAGTVDAPLTEDTVVSK